MVTSAALHQTYGRKSIVKEPIFSKTKPKMEASFLNAHLSLEDIQEYTREWHGQPSRVLSGSFFMAFWGNIN